MSPAPANAAATILAIPDTFFLPNRLCERYLD